MNDPKGQLKENFQQGSEAGCSRHEGNGEFHFIAIFRGSLETSFALGEKLVGFGKININPSPTNKTMFRRHYDLLTSSEVIWPLIWNLWPDLHICYHICLVGLRLFRTIWQKSVTSARRLCLVARICPNLLGQLQIWQNWHSTLSTWPELRKCQPHVGPRGDETPYRAVGFAATKITKLIKWCQGERIKEHDICFGWRDIFKGLCPLKRRKDIQFLASCFRTSAKFRKTWDWRNGSGFPSPELNSAWNLKRRTNSAFGQSRGPTKIGNWNNIMCIQKTIRLW